MSDEARIHASLMINKDDATGIVKFQSYPSDFTADVAGAIGPTPGSFTASVYGTDVDLSELTLPGLAWMTCQDPDNYVTYGIRDPDTDVFYPLGEILPGEAYPIRLSRALGEVWDASGTGTGTAGSSNNVLSFYAHTEDAVVFVGAFET